MTAAQIGLVKRGFRAFPKLRRFRARNLVNPMMTRRQFLKRTALVGANALLGKAQGVQQLERMYTPLGRELLNVARMRRRARTRKIGMQLLSTIMGQFG